MFITAWGDSSERASSLFSDIQSSEYPVGGSFYPLDLENEIIIHSTP